ncbi:hypothetical protein HaLaN_27387 [Haematococcus lacustris]|uniref:Uncharacterized protein n=1 Tax=Haematococcus lacustris TaxID=44745 RepID=A0A6A0A9L2_HAELA|nr:hypothetical protein HaLaN_27387 [Haematococcus lacustris]
MSAHCQQSFRQRLKSGLAALESKELEGQATYALRVAIESLQDGRSIQLAFQDVLNGPFISGLESCSRPAIRSRLYLARCTLEAHGLSVGLASGASHAVSALCQYMRQLRAPSLPEVATFARSLMDCLLPALAEHAVNYTAVADTFWSAAGSNRACSHVSSHLGAGPGPCSLLLVAACEGCGGGCEGPAGPAAGAAAVLRAVGPVCRRGVHGAPALRGSAGHLPGPGCPAAPAGPWLSWAPGPGLANAAGCSGGGDGHHCGLTGGRPPGRPRRLLHHPGRNTGPDRPAAMQGAADRQPGRTAP